MNPASAADGCAPPGRLRLLGQDELPPEAGFARREAHNDNAAESSKAEAAPKTAAVRGRPEGGGSRGNRGFPRATRRARPQSSPSLLSRREDPERRAAY